MIGCRWLLALPAPLVLACAARLDGDEALPAEETVAGPVADAGAGLPDRPGRADGPVAVEPPPGPADAAPGVPAPPPGPDAAPDARGPEASIDDGVLPIAWLAVPGHSPATLGDVKRAGTIRIIEDHDGTHRRLDQAPAAVTSAVGVSLRGSSSRSFPQKSFSLELRDEAQRERKLPVLGMPAEADWALVACWTDKTCMRNALAYAIGERLGRWSPRLRFVEVYFNGEHQGLYQLVESPRQGKGRVPIPAPATEPAAGDISGGYIIRRESGGKSAPSASPPRDWVSPTRDPRGHQTVYTYHYPRETRISTAQKAYLRDHMAAFEATMYGPRWNDPILGYRAWIDVTSWADFALVTELSNRLDGYLKSVYITKLPDADGARGKLQLTPLWDFNIGFGNADYMKGWRTDVWNHQQQFAAPGECSAWLPKEAPICDGRCCGGQNTCTRKCWNSPWAPYWLERVWTDPRFREDLACRWRALRRPGGALDAAWLAETLERWRRQLAPRAVPRHFARWPALRGHVWPNPYRVDPASFAGASAPIAAFFDHEVAWLRGWVERRLRWLDAQLGPCGPDRGL